MNDTIQVLVIGEDPYQDMVSNTDKYQWFRQGPPILMDQSSKYVFQCRKKDLNEHTNISTDAVIFNGLWIEKGICPDEWDDIISRKILINLPEDTLFTIYTCIPLTK